MTVDALAAIAFRPLCEGDLPRVAAWLGRPHVQQWWRDSTAPANVERKYLPRIHGDAPTEVFVILLDSRAIGMIQRYRIDDYPDTHTAIAPSGRRFIAAGGIDYLIGEPELLARGSARRQSPRSRPRCWQNGRTSSRSS